MIAPADTEAPSAAWWAGGRFADWFGDVVSAEVGRLRRQDHGPIAVADDTPIDEDGLGLDSLERLRLSAALAGLLGGGDVPGDRFERLREWGAWREEARRLAATATELGFRTSGSTGRPKLIRHPMTDLLEEVDESAALLTPRRVSALVPAHHIYGFLFTVLLPAWRAIPVENRRGTSVAACLRAATPGTTIVAAPPHVAAMVETGVKVGPGVTLVSSGGPLRRSDHRDAAALGIGRVVEIYGSTETAGVGWRDDPDAPFRLFARWRRHDDDTIVRVSRPDAPAVLLPDVVNFEDEVTFRLLRRRDEAVTVGGVTVHLHAIALALADHPRVVQVIVRPMTDGEGDRLKAFVVPEDARFDPQALRRALDRFAAERLTPPERPRAWSFGPHLPVDDRGKPVDWSIV